MDDKGKYLEILKIELEDLAEDIKLLVDDYKTRRESGEITNYVLLENLALLTHEIHGAESFVNILRDMQPDDYASLDEMVAVIDSKMGDLIEHGGHDPLLHKMVKRKLAKLTAYVSGV